MTSRPWRPLLTDGVPEDDASEQDQVRDGSTTGLGDSRDAGRQRSCLQFLDGKAQARESHVPRALKSNGEPSNLTTVLVQDFEKATAPPTVWVVNIPNENASVQYSHDRPHEKKQCLKLHYHFLGAGNFQYLGIPNKTKIQAPAHKLRFWLRGDNSKCSYGVQVSDAKGETHQFSKNTGQCGLIDFAGWREIAIDLDSPHETWGGDKNGKTDYPLTGIAFTVGQPMDEARILPAEGDLYFDALSVDSERSTDETLGCQVAVLSPGYCSDVRGDTRITLAAPRIHETYRQMLEGRRGLRCRFHGCQSRSRFEGQRLVHPAGRRLSARSDHGEDQRRYGLREG